MHLVGCCPCRTRVASRTSGAARRLRNCSLDDAIEACGTQGLHAVNAITATWATLSPRSSRVSQRRAEEPVRASLACWLAPVTVRSRCASLDAGVLVVASSTPTTGNRRADFSGLQGEHSAGARCACSRGQRARVRPSSARLWSGAQPVPVRVDTASDACMAWWAWLAVPIECVSIPARWAVCRETVVG